MEEASAEEEPPGGTPLLRVRNVELSLRLRKFFVKFEGANPTGTQKDRISAKHISNAIENGYNTVSLGSCGNYGASIAHYARLFGLKTVVGVPSVYAGDRNDEIRAMGGTVIGIDGTYERSLEIVGDMARDNNWYDCSPGSVNSGIDLEGYGTIADEIIAQLGHSPEIVAVPVGNGTTLSGIYKGFNRAYQSGRIDGIPRIVAASTPGGNPIVESWKNGYRTIRSLDPDQLVETRNNEPLISYRSTDGQGALSAIYQSHGFAEYVTDDEMLYYARLIEEAEGISTLPASASALVAASRVLVRMGEEMECVVVLTGRGRT
ncbi:MAG: pyridoxal-phosphate dependent enzyme [Candidatus Thermoplasmatota archaeon]|nr:pyridoxal-phosphate dependent enzyme [Candidatus Thermoplasmatota archaeon]